MMAEKGRQGRGVFSLAWSTMPAGVGGMATQGIASRTRCCWSLQGNRGNHRGIVGSTCQRNRCHGTGEEAGAVYVDTIRATVQTARTVGSAVLQLRPDSAMHQAYIHGGYSYDGFDEVEVFAVRWASWHVYADTIRATMWTARAGVPQLRPGSAM